MPSSRDHDRRAARQAKLAALSERLERAVGQLVTGEDWLRAVEFAARSRSRSFTNTPLIYLQHAEAYEQGRVPTPEPIYVAGFRQWQRPGRSVVKGQSGYMIRSPVTARFASTDPSDPDSWRRLGRGEQPCPGEQVRTEIIGVKPGHVWDPDRWRPGPRTAQCGSARRAGAARVVGWSRHADPPARLRPDRCAGRAIVGWGRRAAPPRARKTALAILDTLPEPRSGDGTPPGLDTRSNEPRMASGRPPSPRQNRHPDVSLA